MRATQLTDGLEIDFRVGEHITASDSSSAVSRASVAAFVLDQLQSNEYVGSTPNILT